MTDNDTTEEIITLMEQLVDFKTTKDRPEELKRILAFVKDYYADTDLVIQEFEREGKPSILISFEKTLEPQFLLLGHLDVVEAPDELFKVTEKEGKLYGRGTDDMKGQDAVILLLMKRLAQQGKKKSIMLALTTDEEIGGQNGAKYLVEQGLKPEIVLAPDAGSDMSIVTKEKGIMHLKLTFKGKSSHGSRPWLGENAIVKAFEAYKRVKKQFPDTTEKDRWKPTCNLGILKGGKAPNQVPDTAEMALDFRYTEKTNEEEILEIVKAAIPEDTEMEIVSRGAPLTTEDDNPWIAKFRENGKKVLGRELELERAHGASDIRHLADVSIPGFLCAAPGENAHGPDEFIYRKGLGEFYEVLESFVLEHVEDL